MNFAFKFSSKENNFLDSSKENNFLDTVAYKTPKGRLENKL